MAARLKPPPDGELDRLSGLVAEQHRRLEVARGELGPPDPADLLVDPLPCRCAKPGLSREALRRLMETARERLEVLDTTLGSMYDAVWPERRAPVPVLRPSPGLHGYGLRSVPDLPNLVVALFFRPASEIEATIARAVAEQQAGDPFLPVFLTNHPDFSALRDRRLAFEYFPFRIDQAAPPPEPSWAAYLVATLELTMRRWGVRQIVSL